MLGLFGWAARLVKACLLAVLLIGGLLIGLLIAIKVLLVLLLLRLWRRRQTAPGDRAQGQVFDAEFTVVPTPPGRASVLVPERGPAALPAPER